MSKVSKRIEQAPIGSDMKKGESIGEYESRKLMKSKAFMNEFYFFKNLDLQAALKSINLNEKNNPNLTFSIFNGCKRTIVTQATSQHGSKL